MNFLDDEKMCLLLRAYLNTVFKTTQNYEKQAIISPLLGLKCCVKETRQIYDVVEIKNSERKALVKIGENKHRWFSFDEAIPMMKLGIKDINGKDVYQDDIGIFFMGYKFNADDRMIFNSFIGTVGFDPENKLWFVADTNNKKYFFQTIVSMEILVNKNILKKSFSKFVDQVKKDRNDAI